MVQYQELEKAISERLEFQRLIEGVAAETSRHSERHMGSLSPSKLAGVLRHVPPGGSDESTLSFNSSSARRAAHGGEGGTLRVTSEIEELRATQAARAALASRRSEARCDTADRFADQEATIEGRLPNPDLPTTDAQLFSELGYLRKERDLVLKEKRVLQQLLSQASEEIRVLIGAEQRHVEELRSWVRQRDDLLAHKSQHEHLGALCEGLRARLEEVASQHRHDKEAWEDEVRALLHSKANSEVAFESLRRESEAARKDLEQVRGLYDKLLQDSSCMHGWQLEAKTVKAQLGERIASLEVERDRLIQENSLLREDKVRAQEALSASNKEREIVQRETEVLKLERAELAQRRAALAAQLQVSESEVHELRMNVADTEATRCQQVNEERARHELEVERMRVQYLSLEAAHETRRQELEGAELEVQRLKGLVLRLTDKLGETEAEIVRGTAQGVQMQRSIAALEAELAQTRVVSSQDKQALHDADVRSAELLREVAALRRETAVLCGEKQVTAAAMSRQLVRQLESLEAERVAWTNHNHKHERFLLSDLAGAGAVGDQGAGGGLSVHLNNNTHEHKRSTEVAVSLPHMQDGSHVAPPSEGLVSAARSRLGLVDRTTWRALSRSEGLVAVTTRRALSRSPSPRKAVWGSVREGGEREEWVEGNGEREEWAGGLTLREREEWAGGAGAADAVCVQVREPVAGQHGREKSPVKEKAAAQMSPVKALRREKAENEIKGRYARKMDERRDPIVKGLRELVQDSVLEAGRSGTGVDIVAHESAQGGEKAPALAPCESEGLASRARAKARALFRRSNEGAGQGGDGSGAAAHGAGDGDGGETTVAEQTGKWEDARRAQGAQGGRRISLSPARLNQRQEASDRAGGGLGALDASPMKIHLTQGGDKRERAASKGGGGARVDVAGMVSGLKGLVEGAEAKTGAKDAKLVLPHVQQILRHLRSHAWRPQGAAAVDGATELLSLAWRAIAIGGRGRTCREAGECVDLLTSLQDSWGLS